MTDDREAERMEAAEKCGRELRGRICDQESISGADIFWVIRDAYLAGHRSRDEEVEAKDAEIAALHEQLVLEAASHSAAEIERVWQVVANRNQGIEDLRANSKRQEAEIAALVDQTYRLGERCAEEQSARVREQDEARAEIAALREAISDFLCECSLEFSDDRVSYERWQISPGSMDDLRRALEEKA